MYRNCYFFILTPKVEFEVISLEVSPSETFVGENVTVSAVVKNIGNAEGTYECSLLVDGTEVETKKITLSAGEMKTVTFKLSMDIEGNYTIQVGKRTTTLTVFPKLFVGAYLEYKVKGIALLITIEGTMRIEVVKVTKENFTISITATGIPGFKPETRTHRFNEPVVGADFKEHMEYIGEEIISTVIGPRVVIHYYYNNVTEKMEIDQYIDKVTNFPLLMVATGEGVLLEVKLSETNIKWLLFTGRGQ